MGLGGKWRKGEALGESKRREGSKREVHEVKGFIQREEGECIHDDGDEEVQGRERGFKEEDLKQGR